MASAWFTDREKGYRRGVKLFCWKKELTEVLEEWSLGRATHGTKVRTPFATRAECITGYDRRCDELVALGWFTHYRAEFARTPARAGATTRSRSATTPAAKPRATTATAKPKRRTTKS